MSLAPTITNSVTDDCLQVVHDGGLIIFPTETLYGIGCVATNEQSLVRVFAAKERATGQPPPVLISDEAQLQTLVIGYSDIAAALMERYWPGYLTLILPAQSGLSPILTSISSETGIATVGVRMTSHPVARALCLGSGHPIVATSANISGAVGREANPQTVSDISETLKARVDIIVDGGPVTGQPSTVIDCTGSRPRILRHGALQLSEDELLSYEK